MVKPSIEQIEWARQEIGVIIHYDVQVFEPSYKFRRQWGYQPDPAVFNPSRLDTDDWLKAAKSAHAKYAVLVAKHCSGFCLWPSKAHGYNVSSSPAGIDIVQSFIDSCRKYDIKPGLYYSTSCNAYCNVDNPGTVRSGGQAAQEEYNQIVLTQLEELWGNYGELFEIWFDGGILPEEKGGINLQDLFERLQPRALKFQGSVINEKNNLRWVGNERGRAPLDCWSTVSLDSQADGTVEHQSLGKGAEDGSRWAPAECDFPNRAGQWFFKSREDYKVLRGKALFKNYLHSVGRNCNMLMGMVIDQDGLVPEKDKQSFQELGLLLDQSFSHCLGEYVSSDSDFSLDCPSTPVSYIVLEEDLEQGHTVNGFEVYIIKPSGREKKIFEAKVIGNKRIIQIRKETLRQVRVCITRTIQKQSEIRLSLF